MPNIWHICHTRHQQCQFIRCVKCAKLLQHATVPSQFWHGTDRCCMIYIINLFSFFSLLFTYISHSPSSHFCILSHLCLLCSSSTETYNTVNKSHYFTTWRRRSPMAAQRCRSHQRPPLDAADHLSSLFHFGFFFIFSFFLFSVHFFWLWFDGWVQVVGYGGGWVEMCRSVVGYGGGWVEMGRSVVGGFGLWVMAVGGLRWWWADQWGGWVGWWWANRWWANQWWRIGGGADLYSDMFFFLFFCFGGGFGGGCGLILVVVVFFFFLVIVAATIFLVVVVAAVVVDEEDDDDDDDGGRNLIYYFNVV